MEPTFIKERMMEKVFVIGRRRTGLKSIAKALEILGYSKSSILVRTKSLEVSGIIKSMQNRNFCVIPFDYSMNDIRAIELAYPTARFILTEREIDSWYSSFLRYYKNDKDKSAYKNKGQYTNQFYIKYNDDLKAHFKGREWKFLNFFYGKNASWQTLCSFQKQSIPVGGFPHEK